ncbi:hypothetical protein A3H38_03990 [candidate division WOR-1 bacterium RIFCSPLOWO2_02_FULL_46_20]|uniref:DUF4760 domain-containing protein n=1 Tax=candidate division WOR-1 bacterium RIFCSPLOWO2_02_FULL_46_20 TaxID=1802567 RepID=A0A1F4RE82_UNCSA|nr:MAG: hypothetical protein A3J44_01980 [candidate division WOR-1 bacterium RIFCSPHIGHO2_02_FULL_45_12]OGC05773.1 MAG: hypothetical protein A3H38_03990 [candidate division WOR-1 bacterium RIFCSPLOWO2_02_FULL_46_20]
MRLQKWPIFLGLLLIVLSALIYYFHYLIFYDAHHIFIYLLSDIAFVPIEVLLVTLILHQLLAYREKKGRLEKMNMVIGTFFSEIGTRLLVLFSDFDPKLEYIKKNLVITNEWTDEEFVKVEKKLRGYEYNVEISKVDFEHLRNLMLEKKEFLIRLLENPNLLEHENFTNILWGIFHLAEELTARKKIKDLPKTDLEHMAGDIKRFYGQLVYQWLDYMKHLKDNYPYLFSLAMRTNPFDESASAEVHG